MGTVSAFFVLRKCDSVLSYLDSKFDREGIAMKERHGAQLSLF